MIVCVVIFVCLLTVLALVLGQKEDYGPGGPALSGAVRGGSYVGCPRKFNFKDDSWLYEPRCDE